MQKRVFLGVLESRSVDGLVEDDVVGAVSENWDAREVHWLVPQKSFVTCKGYIYILGLHIEDVANLGTCRDQRKQIV